MKKLNNKGITLIELVVSFAIVAIAAIYLYQTLSTVSLLYKESKDGTNNFVDVDYTFRMLDKLDDNGKLIIDSNNNVSIPFNDSYFKGTNITKTKLEKYIRFDVTINDKVYHLYKYSE